MVRENNHRLFSFVYFAYVAVAFPAPFIGRRWQELALGKNTTDLCRSFKKSSGLLKKCPSGYVWLWLISRGCFGQVYPISLTLFGKVILSCWKLDSRLFVFVLSVFSFRWHSLLSLNLLEAGVQCPKRDEHGVARGPPCTLTHTSGGTHTPLRLGPFHNLLKNIQ